MNLTVLRKTRIENLYHTYFDRCWPMVGNVSEPMRIKCKHYESRKVKKYKSGKRTETDQCNRIRRGRTFRVSYFGRICTFLRSYISRQHSIRPCYLRIYYHSRSELRLVPRTILSHTYSGNIFD